MSLEPGQVLEGKYIVLRPIAEGGMSTVYRAVNERIGKDVAVKVLHAAVALDESIVERFEREARIGSRISSDHVADVYDFGLLPSGDRFLVMEYLEGESLAARLERDRVVAPKTLAAIASQILEALEAVHEAGIVHRDLKPENVILVPRGKELVVKLVDFGIAKVIADEAPPSTIAGSRWGSTLLRRTAAHAVLGTPLYMAPEQARGHTAEVDGRTDLYALGTILYEALCGEPPFLGENVHDLLFKVALDEPVPLITRVPGVDPALAAIVARAMRKDPAERYASAADMRDAVEAWRAMHASSTSTAVVVVPPVGPGSLAPAPAVPSGLTVAAPPVVPSPAGAPPVPSPSAGTPLSLVVSRPPSAPPPALGPGTSRAEEAASVAVSGRASAQRRAWRRASVALPFLALMVVSALSPAVRTKLWSRDGRAALVGNMAHAPDVASTPPSSPAPPRIDVAPAPPELPRPASGAPTALHGGASLPPAEPGPRPADGVRPAHPRATRSSRGPVRVRKEDIDGGLPPPALDALPPIPGAPEPATAAEGSSPAAPVEGPEASAAF